LLGRCGPKVEAEGVKLNRVLAWLVLVTLTVAGSGTLRADELDALYRRILKEPANTELNLQFARLAEERGTPRWALMAYERVLLNDPENFAAKLGLMRVKAAMAPNITVVSVELGTAYESNPMYYLPGGKSAWLGTGLVTLRDERNINGLRWRTSGAVYGQVNSRYDDLNYAYAGGETGPVFYWLPGLSVSPALGGAVGYFNDRFYYGEGSGSLTFEGQRENINSALRLRAAYRDYDDYFPSQQGWYYEVRGRVAVPDVFGERTLFAFAPWFVWSDISGVVTNALVQEIQPGAYSEWGAKVEVYKTLTDWLTVGASFSASRRDYRNDIVVSLPGDEKRKDTILLPGVMVLFKGFFWQHADLRLDYRYLRNNSNDPTKEFEDHLISATAVMRFDPARGWSWIR
jgi:hypothetical protein